MMGKKGTSYRITVLVASMITCVLLFNTFIMNVSAENTATTPWDGTVASAFAGGNGSQDHPYLISSGEQLALLRNVISTADTAADRSVDGGTTTVTISYLRTAYYKLSADIYLNDEMMSFDGDTGLVRITDGINTAYRGTGIKGDVNGDNTTFDDYASTIDYFYPSDTSTDTGSYTGSIRTWTSIGSSSRPFKGNFDGNGHAISGIYGSSCCGLFYYLNDATVKNVKVINSYIYYDHNDPGSIAATAENSSILNCYNNGTVIGTAGMQSSKAGGIVCTAIGSTIANCCNAGAVYSWTEESDSCAGGIVADNQSGTISNCYNIGTIRSLYNYGCYAGAIVGNNAGQGIVKNCYYLQGCAKNYNDIEQYGLGVYDPDSSQPDTNGVTNAFNTSGILTNSSPIIIYDESDEAGYYSVNAGATLLSALNGWRVTRTTPDDYTTWNADSTETPENGGFPVLAMSATESGGSVITGTGDVNGDVLAKYHAGEHVTTYSIDITWGAMEFDYEAHDTWNVASHKWEANNPEWTVKNSSNNITVTNNSSVPVSATFAFTHENAYTGIDGIFASESAAFSAIQNKLTMPMADEDAPAIVHAVEFTPTEGSIPSALWTYTKIGTITITLEA